MSIKAVLFDLDGTLLDTNELIYNSFDRTFKDKLGKNAIIELKKALNDISTQLPDAIKQSDYYIDSGKLIVTSGNSGVVVDVPTMSNTIITKINEQNVSVWTGIGDKKEKNVVVLAKNSRKLR